MNEVRLIIRFANKPEVLDKETKYPVVRCQWQDLEESRNILVQYLPLSIFLFFFGEIEGLILTDSYFIEGHLNCNRDDFDKRKASFQLGLDRVINVTEGRFGEKVLENVRRKPIIRSVRLATNVDDDGSALIQDSIKEENIFAELNKLVQESTSAIENLDFHVEPSASEKELLDKKLFEDVANISSHSLLKDVLEEDKKKSKPVEKEVPKESIVDMNSYQNSIRNSDLDLGDSDTSNDNNSEIIDSNELFEDN